ncbi:PadR family transcriptional regulator [Gemmatimonadota bacterium]
MDLVRGTLDMLILRALTAGPRHGYDIMGWMKQASDGALDLEEGALYPALHRLEDRGFIEAEWGYSTNNRKAKFYRLTRRGRSQLRAQTEFWNRYVGVVAKLLLPESGAIAGEGGS